MQLLRYQDNSPEPIDVINVLILLSISAAKHGGFPLSVPRGKNTLSLRQVNLPLSLGHTYKKTNSPQNNRERPEREEGRDGREGERSSRNSQPRA